MKLRLRDLREDRGLNQTQVARVLLGVEFPEELLSILPETSRKAAIGVLANDPRPSYQHDPDRIYGLPFAGFDIRFSVQETTLRVHAVEPLENN